MVATSAAQSGAARGVRESVAYSQVSRFEEGVLYLEVTFRAKLN